MKTSSSSSQLVFYPLALNSAGAGAHSVATYLHYVSSPVVLADGATASVLILTADVDSQPEKQKIIQQ